MDEQIARILEQIPGWDATAAVVAPLTGGLTNQNFRVDHGGDSFVVRIGGPHTRLLGIDRGHEYACTMIAAALGVGAPVVHYLPAEDVLITRFIAGTPLAAEAAGGPALLPCIVAAMRCYHAGPVFPGCFSPFATVRAYTEAAQAHGLHGPVSLTRALGFMAQVETALGPPAVLVPCHNDLLASNFLDDGQRVRIVDWEYAAMGDPFFDLGNFAANQALDDAGCARLLALYQGSVAPADLARLRLQGLASDLREACWGLLQTGISGLDFDYPTYARRHLDRFLAEAESPRFAAWLQAVRPSR